MNPKIAIIIPCYNEEKSISGVINEVLFVKSKFNLDLTPIVINDCSTDNSAGILRTLPCISLHLPVNLNIGGAMHTGFMYALINGFDIAIQLDGDGQHPADEIPKLIEPILSGTSDVCIGSRFITKEGFQSSALRRVGINYFKNLNKFLLGITITDSTSGFRALNKKALQIVCDYYPDEYPEPEAIVLYSMNKFVIKEIPVIMRERTGGQSSIRSFHSYYYMVKVTLGILFVYLRLKFNGKRNTL